VARNPSTGDTLSDLQTGTTATVLARKVKKSNLGGGRRVVERMGRGLGRRGRPATRRGASHAGQAANRRRAASPQRHEPGRYCWRFWSAASANARAKRAARGLGATQPRRCSGRASARQGAARRRAGCCRCPSPPAQSWTLERDPMARIRRTRRQKRPNGAAPRGEPRTRLSCRPLLHATASFHWPAEGI
jgi:hypothetical protein